MAIQGPTNFRADKTVAMPDEIITFTWTAATGDFDGYGIGWTGRPYAGGGFTYISKDSTSFSISMDNFPDKANEYIEYTLFAYKYDLDTDNRGAESSVTVYYKKETEEPPAPPVTAINGRLEQFQNSAGGQVFPRTIIEGIFRQSDSKPLGEILAELLAVSGGTEIELPLRIEDGGTGADNAKEAIFNLTSALNDVIAHKAFKNMFFPYIDTDNDSTAYKMPFTQIQTWINNRTGMVNQENTDYGSFIARGIAAGTSDYAAGSTAMTNGTIYLVYE